jgi:hypothetical protein
MATYPGAIPAFPRKTDNVDKVIANDVNLVYIEVEEIAGQLGVGGVNTRDNAWGTTAVVVNRPDWYTEGGGLRGRLANIENALWLGTTIQTIDGGTP